MGLKIGKTMFSASRTTKLQSRPIEIFLVTLLTTTIAYAIFLTTYGAFAAKDFTVGGDPWDVQYWSSQVDVPDIRKRWFLLLSVPPIIALVVALVDLALLCTKRLRPWTVVLTALVGGFVPYLVSFTMQITCLHDPQGFCPYDFNVELGWMPSGYLTAWSPQEMILTAPWLVIPGWGMSLIYLCIGLFAWYKDRKQRQVTQNMTAGDSESTSRLNSTDQYDFYARGEDSRGFPESSLPSKASRSSETTLSSSRQIAGGPSEMVSRPPAYYTGIDSSSTYSQWSRKGRLSKEVMD